MHRDNLVEMARRSMRSASLFVWALFGFLLAAPFWRYAIIVGSALVLPPLVTRAWRWLRPPARDTNDKFPPLSQNELGAARSKLKRTAKQI